MSRGRRRTSVILGLAFVMILLVYSVVTIQGTGAWFSESVENDSSIDVALWDVNIDVDGPLIEIDGLLPGGDIHEHLASEPKTLTVSNHGDVDFYWWIEVAPVEEADLVGNLLWDSESELILVVEKDNQSLYTGTLREFEMAKNENILNFEDDSMEISFYVYLKHTADTTYSSLSTDVKITFHAYQIHAIDEQTGEIFDEQD